MKKKRKKEENQLCKTKVYESLLELIPQFGYCWFLENEKYIWDCCKNQSYSLSPWETMDLY